MDPIRIVHIDDSESQLKTLGDMFRSGFEAEKVLFESRPNCDLLKQEISGEKDLADVYILDNEIGSDRGGELASKIYDKAKESGREVLVISLLCSSEESVEKEFGNDLRQRNIPVFNKNEDAASCGFYIGHCIQNGPISWIEYVKESGLNMPPKGENRSEKHDIDSAFSTIISRGNPGGFYLNPRELVESKKEKFRTFLDAASISVLENMYPSLKSTQER